MSVIAILIFISLTVALLFLAGFIWAVKSGQFEDTLTPSLRVLTEDDLPLPGAGTARSRPAVPNDLKQDPSQDKTT